MAITNSNIWNKKKRIRQLNSMNETSWPLGLKLKGVSGNEKFQQKVKDWAIISLGNSNLLAEKLATTPANL